MFEHSASDFHDCEQSMGWRAHQVMKAGVLFPFLEPKVAQNSWDSIYVFSSYSETRFLILLGICPSNEPGLSGSNANHPCCQHYGSAIFLDYDNSLDHIHPEN